MACVNTNSSDFKSLQDKYNVSSGNLEVLIKSYLDKNNKEEYDPKDQSFIDYLNNYFKSNKINYTTKSQYDKAHTVWERNNGTILNTEEAALSYKKDMDEIFGENNVIMYETKTPNNFIIKINEPILKWKTINIYWGQSESETSTRILSNLAPRKFNYESTDGIIREYGSVEHAYQSNKNGKFNKTTYDAYINKGGYGVKISPKLTEVGKRGNLQIMKDLVVESFIQNPNSEASKKLLQYENFTHNTNELIDKAFLEGLLLARKELIKLNKTESSPINMLEDALDTNNPTIEGFKQWNNKQQQISELFESNPELANAVYKALGFNTINRSEITYTNEEGNPCAKMGLTNTVKGTNWKIVKDFKGKPKHSNGGVDITISDKGVTMRRGGKDIKAKYGLLIINNN